MLCLRARTRDWRFNLAFLCALIAGQSVLADSAEDWARMKGIVPRGYVCCRAESPPRIDGCLDDGAWQSAPWTEDFVDIEGDLRPRPRPRPRFRTRAKMLWDAEYFYLAVEMEEPHVWGTLTKHDSVIFNDNDFEFFIDPDGDNHEYYEFEINALNTGWDLFLPRPYKDGGRADNGWEIPGLITAVDIKGTLNDPSDRDTGWTVEIAVPWPALREYARRPCPPRDGDQWRVNFSRVEWEHQIEAGKYRKVPETREDNWVWSPQGIIDMHRPERWGYVQFSTSPPGTTRVRPDPTRPGRDALLGIYHHQKAFQQKHQRWAQSLDELGLDPAILALQPGPPRLKATDSGFLATVEVPLKGGDTGRNETEAWSIRHDSRIRRVSPDDELSDSLEAILSQQAAAWNRGDLDAFMEHYWKSDELTFSSGGRTSRGWQTTKENYQQRYPTRERMGQLSFGAIDVTSLGDSAALVLGRWHLERDPAPVGGNFSLVFRRVEGAWVIVHDHTSLEKVAAADLPQPVQAALDRAGDNRGQIEQALRDVPAAQQAGMQFLVAHMPDTDLQSLSAEFLLENVRFAYQAWDESPWKDDLPPEIFLNNVLPYANINERRDRWRKDFYERFKPLVKEAKTPAEAAAILNQQIFPLLKVRYSTERRKADQSPYESIRTGLASCTGLSVLLIDACRAVGVPARFVGTPLWTNKSGNHSWVEIWDKGWHFTGAAEPTGADLDKAWFVDRAAAARRDDPQHAIYAVSFQRTPQKFPLVWDPGIDYVYSVNVTDFYTRLAEKFPDAEPIVDTDKSRAAVEALERHLSAEQSQRPPLQNERFAATPLTRPDAERAGKLLWQDHVARIRQSRAAEMTARELTDGDLKMPFYYEVFGEKPKEGRSLYLSMHGGGGAPKEVNDRQWENQKKLYRLEEGVYLAPRAPTNTWNLWHEEHIDRLFGRLIENLIVFEEVDPDRVYLMGYSAGGDGVFQLAPRMADRWAAAAMMAGHPNETSPLGLRNIAFTIHMGGLDSAYNRNQVAREWEQKLAELRKADPDGYVHLVKIYADKGHWLDRQDAAAIPWMAQYRRNPMPARVVWKQDDVRHSRFYWLAAPADGAQDRAEVTAVRQGQQFDVRASGVQRLMIRVNDNMLDLDQPLTVNVEGQRLFSGMTRRTIAVLARTLAEYGDPRSVFSAELTIDLPSEPGP